jgi:hypothetical protein
VGLSVLGIQNVFLKFLVLEKGHKSGLSLGLTEAKKEGLPFFSSPLFIFLLL